MAVSISLCVLCVVQNVFSLILSSVIKIYGRRDDEDGLKARIAFFYISFYLLCFYVFGWFEKSDCFSYDIKFGCKKKKKKSFGPHYELVCPPFQLSNSS